MNTFRCFFLLFGLNCLNTAARAQTKDSGAYRWIDFQWMGATIDGKSFPKAAIFLPVQIDGLNGTFMAQFDLGADITELYGNALKNYYSDRAALLQQLDTVNKGVSDGGVTMYPVKGLGASTGGYPLGRMYYAEGFGDEIPKDSLFTVTSKLIGTIGASFVKDKVLVIDYPNHRMCVLDTLDGYWSARTTFVEGRVRKGRIQVPLTIGGKIEWVLYDTGASIFPLWVGKKLWSSMVDPKAKVDSMMIPSWGEQVRCYGAQMGAQVFLSSYRLPRAELWYSDSKRLNSFNEEEGIAGLTGNAYFLGKTIVIDFKNMRFGVLR